MCICVSKWVLSILTASHFYVEDSSYTSIVDHLLTGLHIQISSICTIYNINIYMIIYTHEIVYTYMYFKY